MARNIYDEMTNDERDYSLEAILERMNPKAILAVPGVAEVLLEALNDEILDEWRDEYTAECDECGTLERKDDMTDMGAWYLCDECHANHTDD